MLEPTQEQVPQLAGSIGVLRLAVCIVIAVIPHLSAEITLVDRLSDAQAYASAGENSDSPPKQIQLDFLPAHLSNSAMASSGQDAANAHCTSNSSIVLNQSMGTLRITGDGAAHGEAWA